MRTPKRCLRYDSTHNFHHQIDIIIMPDRNYFIVCIIFAQLSKGKSVGYLNALYNDLLRTLHIVCNTVSLSYIFRIQFAIRWMVNQSCNGRLCNNWFLCKYLFAKYFHFFSTSETHVRLLIMAENLANEKKKDMEELLTKVVEAYVKNNREYSRDNRSQALKAFTDHLNNVYKMFLVTLGRGSLVIILDCPTLESLELLWRDYRSGHLNKVAERYLVTDELRKELNLETICLKATITEKNYQNCRKALMKLPSTNSGKYKHNIEKSSFICISCVKKKKKKKNV